MKYRPIGILSKEIYEKYIEFIKIKSYTPVLVEALFSIENKQNDDIISMGIIDATRKKPHEIQSECNNLREKVEVLLIKNITKNFIHQSIKNDVIDGYLFDSDINYNVFTYDTIKKIRDASKLIFVNIQDIIEKRNAAVYRSLIGVLERLAKRGCYAFPVLHITNLSLFKSMYDLRSLLKIFSISFSENNITNLIRLSQHNRKVLRNEIYGEGISVPETGLYE